MWGHLRLVQDRDANDKCASEMPSKSSYCNRERAQILILGCFSSVVMGREVKHTKQKSDLKDAKSKSVLLSFSHIEALDASLYGEACGSMEGFGDLIGAGGVSLMEIIKKERSEMAHL